MLCKFLAQHCEPLCIFFIYNHKLSQNPCLRLTFYAVCIMIFRSKGAALAPLLCDIIENFSLKICKY